MDRMHADDIAAWRQAHVPAYNSNALKLGIFGANCSNGCTMTHAETTFEPTYAHNVAIAKRAETIGRPIEGERLVAVVAGFKQRADQIGEINDAELIAIIDAVDGVSETVAQYA